MTQAPHSSDQQPHACVLEHRGVLRLGGPDVRTFLQGIVSTDVEKVTRDRAIWSAFLTPQGKFLHEFFLAELGGDLFLDGEAARLADLKRRLSLYRLRSKVEIEDVSEAYRVVALFGEGASAALGLEEGPGTAKALTEGGVAFAEPRLPELGARAILPIESLEGQLSTLGFLVEELAAYDRMRIALGVPDGSRDLEVERSILLENGFDELHGVDWDKGCFMGQELTARTRYRGLIKKRLLPVEVEGPSPPAGTPVERDGREIGVMRSTIDGLGLATLRLEQLDRDHPETFTAGEAKVTPRWPAWVRLQERAKTQA